MAVDEVPRSAIIINSPYIERILAGEKTWEMRSRNCTKRELIGLIRKGSGKVVGLARVIDVRGPLTRGEILANLDKHRRSREDLDSPALAKNNFAWVLKDARPLAQPVSYKHKCYVPDDYIPRRSYPLFRAREVLEDLAAGADAGSP